jgi:hypothetical protein
VVDGDRRPMRMSRSDLPRWWRAAGPVGVSGRREREQSESETEYQRDRRERREFWRFFLFDSGQGRRTCEEKRER